MIFQKDFNIDLFRVRYRVVFTDMVEIEALKYGNKPEDTSRFEAIVFDFEGNPIVIFNTKTSYNVIAHEVTHLVYSILSTRGMNLADETNETYAYCIGYVVESILKFAAKHPEITIK